MGALYEHIFCPLWATSYACLGYPLQCLLIIFCLFWASLCLFQANSYSVLFWAREGEFFMSTYFAIFRILMKAHPIWRNAFNQKFSRRTSPITTTVNLYYTSCKKPNLRKSLRRAFGHKNDAQKISVGGTIYVQMKTHAIFVFGLKSNP